MLQGNPMRAPRRANNGEAAAEEAAAANTRREAEALATLLLPGEEVVKSSVGARWRGETFGEKELVGLLRLTNFRLVFSRYSAPAGGKAQRRGSILGADSDDVPAAFNSISLPLALLCRVEFNQRLGQQVR